MEMNHGKWNQFILADNADDAHLGSMVNSAAIL